MHWIRVMYAYPLHISQRTIETMARHEQIVHYLDLPKRFVAGAVFDPEEDECIQGAVVTLTDSKSSETFTTETDYFGDFWLRKLKVGEYSLSIKKDGYLPKEIGSISTEKDVNVGDIELYLITEA